MPQKALIIGTGPAALMAADRLLDGGVKPTLFERRRGPGWKFLVAGSSGLNVTYDASVAEFAKHYGENADRLTKFLSEFSPQKWLEKIHSLGLETFRGTSRRFFLKTMKSSPLLRAWIKDLGNRGAVAQYGEEFSDFRALPDGTIEVTFQSGRKEIAENLLLALGGASWENSPPAWVDVLRKKRIEFTEFAPSNAGFHLDAPKEFFREAEGTPIKGLTLKTARGERQGELMITRYGLEGTPVYTLGCPGPAILDLKPDLTEEKLEERIKQGRGTIMQRLEQSGKLAKGALLLLKHLAKEKPKDAAAAAKLVKSFPIVLLDSRPLSESISSKGGVCWKELTDELELKKFPGVYCAGEMIDWDAPTGGFLIQACVSMGYAAANGIIRKIRA